jgi:Tol biopolymer transport system component
LLFALATASCLSGGGSGRLSDLSDQILIVRSEGLTVYTTNNGESLLLPNPEQSVLTEPALSPDGARIAYVRQLTPIVLPGQPIETGADLFLANRDGSGARLLLLHQQQNEQIRAPAWFPDGDRLLINVQRIQTAQILTDLEVLDTSTGTRSTLVTGALLPALSQDGTRIAYVRQDAQYVQTLYVANADGSNERAVIGPDQGMGSISSPRFSPDGRFLVFAVSPVLGAPGGIRSGQEYVSRAGAALAASNGLPMDIWTMELPNGEPRPLATLQLDQPGLVWSGDSERIFVLAGAGIFVIDVEDGASQRLGEGTFHGQLAWLSE